MRISSATFSVVYALQFVLMLMLPRTQANVWALAGTAFATLVFGGVAILNRMNPPAKTNAPSTSER